MMRNLGLLVLLLIVNYAYTQPLSIGDPNYFVFQEQLFQKECESNDCLYKYVTGFSPGEPSMSVMKWLDYTEPGLTIGTRKIYGQNDYKYMMKTNGDRADDLYSFPPVLLANNDGDFRLTFDVNSNSKVERYGVMIGFKDFDNFCALEIIPKVNQAYIRSSIQGIELDQGPFFINDDLRNGNINIVGSGSNIIFAYNGKPIKMISKNLRGNLIIMVMKGTSAKILIDNFKLTKQKLN